MSGSRVRVAVRALRGLSVGAVMAGSALVAVPAASAADGSARPVLAKAVQFPLAQRLAPGTRLDPSILPRTGPVTVMLELDAANPAVAVTAKGLTASTKAGAAAVRAERAHVDALTSAVRSRLTGATKATVLFTLHNVYSGIAVRTDASRLTALAALPGVKAVHRMPLKSLLNSSTVPLVGAPTAWDHGVGAGPDIGTGVRIGVIDTGIDYTHADFGGTGTVAAYKADHAVDDSAVLNVPSHDYPSAKVAGGWDFVGDGYDPSAAAIAHALPQGDPNPLDCDGHGSHVAGSAAGLGVTSAGAAYAGPWTASTPFGTLKIGPGVAPGATLYALRVFGCSGDTNVVSKALDWAADPNGDGNFADHLDVVNMSLGTDFAAPDDPDSVASDALSLLGTTVVAAAGNGGDEQDIVGSPGSANRVISVAASQDAQTIYDALQVTAPASLAGTVAGQENDAFDWVTKPAVSGAVAALSSGFNAADPASYTAASMSASNADGCDTLTAAQAAAVTGKIAWLEWTDNDALRRCGSAARADNAAAAGAIGVVLADDSDNFAAGITGSAVVPTFEIRKSDAAALRPAVGSTLALTLTHALHGSKTVLDPSLTDVISPFSSRGITDAGNLKPDLTAPGSTVFSAKVGTGNDGLSDSGTSMASPHVAGAAALVKAAHPGWTPEQIKAALVDTAVHDVWSDSAHTAREAPDRVGSGRLDAGAAVATNVLAYNTDNPGSVSVSYGLQTYTKDATVAKTVLVTNDAAAAVTYALGFDWANAGTHPGGVTFSFPPSVTVPAHGTAQVQVLMHITVAALTRTLDAAHAVGTGGDTAPYLSEASGWLTLAPPAGGQNLRLSVFAAPRPGSTMKASGTLAFGRNSTAKLGLMGGGVRQDGGAYQSLVSGYELQLASPRKPVCKAKVTTSLKCTSMASDLAGDLKYVGVASDAPLYAHPDAGLTYFAVSTFGPWRSPTSYAEYDVYIDTSGDGKADAVLLNMRVTGTDQFASVLVNVKSGEVIGNSAFPLDNADGRVDTNVFTSDELVLPVATSALTRMSKAAHSGKIQYWVAAGTLESGLTDLSKRAFFNVLKPGLTVIHGPRLQGQAGAQFGGEQFFADLGKSFHVPALTILRGSTYAGQHPLGLMLLHSDNVQGNRVQVVPVAMSKTSVKAAVSATALKAGVWLNVKATVRSARTGIGAPRGTVRFYVDGKPATQRVVDVHGVARLATRSLTKGVHVIGVRYTGNGTDWLPSKATVKVTVT